MDVGTVKTVYLLLALAIFMQGVHVLKGSSICDIAKGSQGKNRMIRFVGIYFGW